MLGLISLSGKFGHGGVFDALRAKSGDVPSVYEMAGRMDNLHVGYALLVEDVGKFELGSVEVFLPSVSELSDFC